MKKQIVCCISTIILVVGNTSIHAEENVCYYTSTGSEWVACTEYGNPAVEKCGPYWGYRYRCAAGYYYWEEGAYPTSCTSSCLKCPDNGTSNPGDNDAITKCYQKPGTHSDKTGTYKVTADCYYKE